MSILYSTHLKYLLLIFVFIILLSQLVNAKVCERKKAGRKALNDSLTIADVVLSATIREVTFDTDGSLQSLSLRTRRIFKGREYLTGKRHVTVFGIEEVECPKHLSLHSTLVFPLSVSGDHFFLASSIFPINLSILDSLHAFARGLPHRKRRKPKHTVCESSLCPLGSKCSIETGMCECRSHCRSAGPPVCGTDHVSYASHCHLSIRSCLLHKKGKSQLKLASHGHCSKRNPCDDLRCGPGEDCVVSHTNGILSATCVCPASCPNYGDAVDSSPVCSTNGVDYPSLCKMKQHACSAKTNITAKYFGKCDPCRDFTCPTGTSCHLGAHRKPECRCSEQCPLNFDPVCGTDGKTYSNECVMRVSGCKLDQALEVFKKGKCEDIKTPCSDLTCSHGAQCQIRNETTASCECDASCSQIMKPICATNGMTFDNDCELRRYACEQKARVAVKHQGTCGFGLCASFEGCVAPQVCILVQEKPVCACPECSDELREVCASNGRTYPNECKMRREACLLDDKFYVKYNGVCDGCSKISCEFYSVCISDGISKPGCRCPNDCPNIKDTKAHVCGTDGVTYSSECHLRRSACEQKKFIVVAFKGKCDACQHVECRYGEECRSGICVCSYNCPSNPPASMKVCGENGVLYPSECHLQLAACQKSSPISVMPLAHCHSSVSTFSARYMCSASSCSHGGYCSTDLSQCICEPKTCKERNYSQCGSDGNVYLNQCHMNIVSCLEQRDIHVQPRLSDCAQRNYDTCECNRIGSIGPACDSDGFCACRAGIAGKKCDHCLPSFWGIHLIANGALSCQPCGCSAFGSARADCEQSTGRCECKNGAFGDKCDKCGSDMIMTPSGCVSKEEYHSPGDCNELKCYHDAICSSEPDGSLPDCICPEQCNSNHLGIAANMTVCGTDGVTYENFCQLQQFACKHQIDLVVKSLGICDEESEIVDRFERNKDSTVRLGSHCTLPSDCAEINAICKLRANRRGVCSCSDASRRTMDGRCEVINEIEEMKLDVKINGRNGYRVDIKDLYLYFNFSLEINPQVSNGLILLGEGEEGSNFQLRLENRRFVVEIGDDLLYSRDYVPLHLNSTVSLVWKNKLATLHTSDARVSMRIETKNQKLRSLWIGSNTLQFGRPNEGTIWKLNVNQNPIYQNNVIPLSNFEGKASHPYLHPLSFVGDGYLEFFNVSIDIRNRAEFEIQLKPVGGDGLILHWTSTRKEEFNDDFISLFLIGYEPHLYWDLGSGVGHLKGTVLNSQQFNTIRFGHHFKNGSISVNGKSPIFMNSPGRQQHLDILHETLYVGGLPPSNNAESDDEKDRDALPNHHLISSELQSSLISRKSIEPFRGRIDWISINEQMLDFRMAKIKGEVSRNIRCSQNCDFGETCYQKKNDQFCRGATNVTSIQLSGRHDFGYPNSGDRFLSSTNSSTFSFEFKPQSSNGIIWWESTWLAREDGDFFIIYLTKGQLKMGLNLGNDLKFRPVVLKNKIENGEWYTINVDRKDRRIRVKVNSEKELTIVTTPGSTELNTNGIVYLGGRKNCKKSSIPVQSMFTGCVRNLVLNMKPVNLLHDSISDVMPSACGA